MLWLFICVWRWLVIARFTHFSRGIEISAKLDNLVEDSAVKHSNVVVDFPAPHIEHKPPLLVYVSRVVAVILYSNFFCKIAILLLELAQLSLNVCKVKFDLLITAIHGSLSCNQVIVKVHMTGIVGCISLDLILSKAIYKECVSLCGSLIAIENLLT